MKATILDLRRRMPEVLRALDRNEPVTILYRGRAKAVLYPAAAEPGRAGSARDHAAFGMWKDRADLKNVAQLVRKLRQGRADAV